MEVDIPEYQAVGNRYKVEGQEYILAGFKMDGKEYSHLVNISSGETWGQPVEVIMLEEISTEEFFKVVNSKQYRYSITLISEIQ